MGQIVGLKSVNVGPHLANGVNDEALTTIKAYKKITQPYQGGVTTNFSMPSTTEFFREGQAEPFYSAVDTSSATKKLSWEVADFDEDTLKFYFGEEEPEEGKLYEGDKFGFVFNAVSGYSIAFARLKYSAILTGTFSSSEPLRISVEATVLTPENGGKAWWVIETPEYTGGDGYPEV